MRTLFIKALVMALTLSGCSSDAPEMPNPKVYLTRFSQLLKKPKVAAPVNILGQISPELVAQLSTPTIAVKLQKSGAQALLAKTGDNRDTVTYATADNISLTLRNGIIIASRGMAGDLMSSDISAFEPGIFRKWPPAYSRSYFWLNGVDHITRETFSCTALAIESKAITVLGSQKNTTHIRESCNNDTTTITNDYWLSPKLSVIITSNQWLGPVIGYMEVTSIKD